MTLNQFKILLLLYRSSISIILFSKDSTNKVQFYIYFWNDFGMKK